MVVNGHRKRVTRKRRNFAKASGNATSGTLSSAQKVPPLSFVSCERAEAEESLEFHSTDSVGNICIKTIQLCIMSLTSY